jgi:hypothetical protein
VVERSFTSESSINADGDTTSKGGQTRIGLVGNLTPLFFFGDLSNYFFNVGRTVVQCRPLTRDKLLKLRRLGALKYNIANLANSAESSGSQSGPNKERKR